MEQSARQSLALNKNAASIGGSAPKPPHLGGLWESVTLELRSSDHSGSAADADR